MAATVPDDAALSWWQALLDADGNFLIGLAVLTAVAIVALMVAALYTVRRAQEATPPVVVTVIVLSDQPLIEAWASPKKIVPWAAPKRCPEIVSGVPPAEGPDRGVRVSMTG